MTESNPPLVLAIVMTLGLVVATWVAAYGGYGEKPEHGLHGYHADTVGAEDRWGCGGRFGIWLGVMMGFAIIAALLASLAE